MITPDNYPRSIAMRPQQKIKRAIKSFAFLSLSSLALYLVLGEVFFRFVIPAARYPWGYYDSQEQIPRFDLGQGSGVATIGKLAQRRVRWQINNAGWNSAVDYFQRGRRTKPVIAIIGDSYIEALQVDIRDNIASVLGAKVEDQYDVYSFGRSGAPLSEYLQMSRYVVKYFDPEVIVVNVVDNDFDESLSSVRSVPYFVTLETAGSNLEESALPAKPVSAKLTTKLIFASAIFRYLWHNLSYGERWTELRPLQSKVKAVEEGESDSPHLTNEIYRAAEYVVKTMRANTMGKELIFMIDAPRRDIYAGTVQISNVLWMNKLLRELTERYQARFVDLTAPFWKTYQENERRFNYQHDYHWNEEGHKYAAEVLYRNLIAFGIVKNSRSLVSGHVLNSNVAVSVRGENAAAD